MVGRRAAFTITELVVAMGIVLVLMGVLLTLVLHTSEGSRIARARAGQFQQAQRAFETLAQRVGQATLNSYWDSYTVTGTSSTVRRYQRMSELRFVSGPMQAGGQPLDNTTTRMRPGHGVFFHAATGRLGADRDAALLGLDGLVNTWGYFVEVGSDSMPLPPFLASQSVEPLAPRLMEFCEPPQQLSVYSYSSGKPDYAGFEWFRVPLANRAMVRAAAENIAVLLVHPKLTAPEAERLLPGATKNNQDAIIAPQLFYHSGAAVPAGTAPERNMRHRLPPVIELTMVALDSASVSRIYSPTDLDPLKMRDTFRDALSLQADLQGDPANPLRDSLEARLIAKRANYRIFATTIAVRSAQ